MQKTNDAIVTNGACISRIVPCVLLKRDNGNVHRAAAKIIVSKSRAARGSVCNALLSDDLHHWFRSMVVNHFKYSSVRRKFDNDVTPSRAGADPIITIAGSVDLGWFAKY